LAVCLSGSSNLPGAHAGSVSGKGVGVGWEGWGGG
jgi:hypothetical protein